MNEKQLLRAFGLIDDDFIEALYHNQDTHRKKFRATALIVIAAILSLLTGCAVAYTQGWFTFFFTQRSEMPLSEGQVNYISQNEQIIGESQTKNGWTVELRSAIHDSSTIYIILGITAPEGVDLEPEIVNGRPIESFSPGNSGEFGIHGVPDVLTAPPGVGGSRWHNRWEEDGDGLDHTKNYVIQMHLDTKRGTIDPFEEGGEYRIHIENIVRHYQNEAYLQDLMNEKYKGQTDVIFTFEEIERIHCMEILTEDTWDFVVSFTELSEGVELLTGPIFTMADLYWLDENDIPDGHPVTETVKITSFVLNPLSAVITYEHHTGACFTGQEKCIYVVMRDGSRVELQEVEHKPGYNTLDASSPIVMKDVDYVLMADGTEIPVP